MNCDVAINAIKKFLYKKDLIKLRIYELFNLRKLCRIRNMI